MIQKIVRPKSVVSIILIISSSILFSSCCLLLGLTTKVWMVSFKINLVNSSENAVVRPKSMLANAFN